MSNKEILEESIQDAIDGGWEPFADAAMDVNGVMGWFELDEAASSLNYENYKLFIFNHDFAKALWGEERGTNVKVNKDGSISPIKASKPFGMYVIPAWQHHLQQMVIAEDPIKYLGDNIQNG